MNTMTLRNVTTKSRQSLNLPVSARGRALRTVSWFLTGIEPVRSFDETKANLAEVNRVYV